MELIFVQNGRLGNAIFRYLASSLLAIKYGYQYKNLSYKQFSLLGCFFINEDHIKDIINNKKIQLPKRVLLREFYQHDYINHRDEIIKYIETHKSNHTITSDDGKTFYMNQIMDTPQNFDKYYDIVIHIRMGDFIENIYPYRVIISLKYYFELLDKMDLINKKIAVVGENPKTPLEKAYTSQLMNYFKNKNVNAVYETNDLLTDFHIVKNANTVICCMSTFSWTAVFLSNKVQTCYFPNYPVKPENKWISMKKPCSNTIYYKFHDLNV